MFAYRTFRLQLYRSDCADAHDPSRMISDCMDAQSDLSKQIAYIRERERERERERANMMSSAKIELTLYHTRPKAACTSKQSDQLYNDRV